MTVSLSWDEYPPLAIVNAPSELTEKVCTPSKDSILSEMYIDVATSWHISECGKRITAAHVSSFCQRRSVGLSHWGEKRERGGASGFCLEHVRDGSLRKRARHDNWGNLQKNVLLVPQCSRSTLSTDLGKSPRKNVLRMYVNYCTTM